MSPTRVGTSAAGTATAPVYIPKTRHRRLNAADSVAFRNEDCVRGSALVISPVRVSPGVAGQNCL